MEKTKSKIFFFIVLGVAFLAFPEWNLPYPQPAKWNYSTWYASDIAVMLTNNPSYFKDKMTARWTFFKSNFIMSNGLVNHKRLDQSNNVIGTNEAVSEGQGYGMLLALLNNDQATFNKIFEAANSIMWNNNNKSYFCWSWNGGCVSQGAATDADLDIGLALVFADRLVIQKYWTAHSNPDYKTRALEIIRTIRTKMCDGSNYLLAGDNWGGNSPQNPSYYSVAWMKVFNTYCKANNVNDIDFTPVITRCYEVLGKVRFYSKGQTPDWCNTAGQVYSGKTYGMGADGIRTPFRIAMDALWFNDSRAIAYCKNIKGTLTEYTNSNANYLIAQMGQYNDQGSIVAETYRCNEVGLWMCGALGSMDNAFQKGVFRQNVLFAMQGDYSFFGSPTYSDDKFYFKQATAGLAYAAFTGQFPNVWEDTFSGVRDEKQSAKYLPVNIRVTYSNGRITLSPAPQRTPDIRLYSLAGEKVGIASHCISKDRKTCSVFLQKNISGGTYIIRIDNALACPMVAQFVVP